MINALKTFSIFLLVLSPVVGLVAFGLGSDYYWILYIATIYVTVVLGILNLGLAIYITVFGIFIGFICMLFSTAPILPLMCSCICFVNLGGSFKGSLAVIKSIKRGV